MTVTILVNFLITIGDVEINAPRTLTCVIVETKVSVMNTGPDIIAAPTLAAHEAEALSHVPKARCWTSVSLVRTGVATLAMTPPCI